MYRFNRYIGKPIWHPCSLHNQYKIILLSILGDDCRQLIYAYLPMQVLVSHYKASHSSNFSNGIALTWLAMTQSGLFIVPTTIWAPWPTQMPSNVSLSSHTRPPNLSRASNTVTCMTKNILVYRLRSVGALKMKYVKLTPLQCISLRCQETHVKSYGSPETLLKCIVMVRVAVHLGVKMADTLSSLLRWIWSISEYNLTTRDSPKWTLESECLARVDLIGRDPRGIPKLIK